MVSCTINSLTLCDLIGAFIDLILAYFLLCGSTFVFFASKFCKFFGLYLPCPCCTGIFGYQNSNICLHRLLVDWMRREISSVQMLVKSNFPFDLMFFKHQPCNLDLKLCMDRKYDKEVVELEKEASSSSFTGPKLQNVVDKESGFDAKGKKIVNQKQKYGFRRRRRTILGYGKSPTRLVVAGGGSSSTQNSSDMRSQITDCLDPVTGIEDDLQDDGNVANGLDMGERTWHSFEQSGLSGKNKFKDDDSSSVENLLCFAQDKSGNAGNEENVIRMMEEALEEEKATCAALYLELEKERAASASAADEAMAMILRLQADKASIEMEARQYQRMIEDKFAYDEEEMEILKEIVVRRERENYFLEKEVEAYRQVNCLGNGQSEVDLSCPTTEWEQKPSRSLGSNQDLPLVQHGTEKSKSIGKNKEENDSNWSSTCEIASAELTFEAAQTCSGSEKVLSCYGDKRQKDREHGTEVDGNSEPIVYDVHVIDDKTELRKNESGKENGLSYCAAADFGVWNSEVSTDCTGSSVKEAKTNNQKSSFEMKNEVPVFGISISENLPFDSARNSSTASGERLKIDTEVELLRERLRIVQEGKEKLKFSSEHTEFINSQLKLVEEMVNQLREIRQLRDPVRQASLPPSSAKVSLKGRRCRSVSVEARERS